MIGLLWAALRARKAAAVMTLLLAAFAAMAAAAGPLYGATARQLSHAAMVDSASPDARALIANRAHVDDSFRVGKEFAYPYIPGFQTVHGYLISGVVTGWEEPPLLASRTGVCGHVTVVKGRCAVADHEVILREDTADRLGLPPGSDLTFRFSVPGETSVVTPLTVVGTYRAIDPTDPYWARRSEILEAPGGPIFTTDRTVRAASPLAGESLDLTGTPAAFGNTDELKSALHNERDRLSAAGFVFGGGLDDFIATVDHSDALLRNSLIVAVFPLILLSWLVLFLAVTGAVNQRRAELGLVALRGVPVRLRWLLPALETAVPALAGALPGYVLGYLAVAVLVPGGRVELNAASVWYTAIAVVGALAAGAAAQLGALRQPVLELLRRTRSGRRPTARRLTEAIAGTLAVAAGLQAVLAGNTANGLGLLAPLGFSLGLGLLAARLLARPADRFGRGALRRGWVRLGVVSLALARRPGTTATVVLLTVVFGLLGFAFAAADVSQRAWQQRAVVEVGADRVISVAALPVPQLVAAVNQVDPRGDFAMATARMDVGSTTPILAVQSERLPKVVPWLATTPSALRPEAPDPFLVSSQLVLPIDLRTDPDAVVSLGLRLATASGGQFSAATPALHAGPGSYAIALPQCSPCRVEQLEVKFQLRRATARMVIGLPAQWRNADRWVHADALPGAPALTLTTASDGLMVDAQEGAETLFLPAGIPRPLPMVAAGVAPQEITGYAGAVVYPVSSTHAAMVPRFGTSGALVDLDYADLGPSGGGDASKPEVWLSSSAPADVDQRLQAAGLTIVDRRSIAATTESMRAQAPALALRFLVAATIAALVLGAGALLVLAALEREERDGGLSVLRPQGVRGGLLGTVAVGSRWAALLLSVAVGLLSAALAWLLARGVLPVFIDISRVPPAALPGSSSVLRPMAFAGAALAIVCLIAARTGERRTR